MRRSKGRKGGISAPAVQCPLLVISGSQYPEDRGHAVAQFYGASERMFPELDHWGLVLDPRIPREIARFLTNLPL